MTRGHVRGEAPTEGGPYLIRAWEKSPGEWVGEAWAGTVIVVTVHGQYSREDALAVAEKGLTMSFREGYRLRGLALRPEGELRAVARNERGTEAARWAPADATPEEIAARFAPGYEVIAGAPPFCVSASCKNVGQFDGRCYFHRDTPDGKDVELQLGGVR